MIDTLPSRAGPAREPVRAWHAAVLYTVLTVALAWPIVRHAPNAAMSPSSDTDLFAWTLAWDTHAFTHQPLSIFDANIFAPNRRTLAYSENAIGSALVAAPILWLTGNPVLALNLVPLIACALCGLGTFLLARRLRIGSTGALVAGLVFAFAPPRFLRLDQLFLATIQWVPFSLAYLHGYFDGRRPRDLRIAIAFFTLQALTSGHGAVFLGVAIGFVIVWRLLTGERPDILRRIRDVGVAGALLLVPLALMAIPYLHVQRELGLRRTLDEWRVVSPASWLSSPTYLHQYLLDTLVPDARINTYAGAYLFPGYLPILLALVALVLPPVAAAHGPMTMTRWWRRAALALDAAFLLSAAVAIGVSWSGPMRVRIGSLAVLTARTAGRAWLGAIVALGVRIAIRTRAPFRPPANPLPALGRWLRGRRDDPVTVYVALVVFSVLLSIGPPLSLWPHVYWLPGFSFIRAPSRFTLIGVLGLAVLAGAGFDRLTRRTPPRRALAAAAIATIVLVAEFAVHLDAVPYRIPMPAADRWLATQPKPFTVAEVPLGELQKHQSEFMLHSMAHWQKTVHGWSGIFPPHHVDLFDAMSRFPDEASLQALRAFGVTYVVVHADLYPAPEWPGVEARLATFGNQLELRYRDNTSRVYTFR